MIDLPIERSVLGGTTHNRIFYNMSICFHRIRRNRGDKLPRVLTICSRNVMILILTYLFTATVIAVIVRTRTNPFNQTGTTRNVVVSIILTWCFFNTNRFIFLAKTWVGKMNIITYCYFFLSIFLSCICSCVFFFCLLCVEKKRIWYIPCDKSL